LEPQSPRSDLCGFLGDGRTELRPPEDIDEADRLADLGQRRDPSDAKDLRSGQTAERG
jgi:hypothetical protein